MSQQFGTGAKMSKTPAEQKEQGGLKITLDRILTATKICSRETGSTNRSAGRRDFSASSSLGLD